MEGGRGERQNMVKNGEKGRGLAVPERASIYITLTSVCNARIRKEELVCPEVGGRGGLSQFFPIYNFKIIVYITLS